MFVIKLFDYMYEIPFFPFLLNYAFVAITDITIAANLMVCELVILTCMNGCAYDIFEIKSLNSNLLAPRGHLVCVYKYF